jgi:hypothetical protein
MGEDGRKTSIGEGEGEECRFVLVVEREDENLPLQTNMQENCLQEINPEEKEFLEVILNRLQTDGMRKGTELKEMGSQ